MRPPLNRSDAVGIKSGAFAKKHKQEAAIELLAAVLNRSLDLLKQPSHENLSRTQ